MVVTSQAPDAPPGLAARRAAAELLEGVLYHNTPVDEHLDGGHGQTLLRTLPERDRALTRRIVATSLRKLGTLRKLIGDYLDRGPPKKASGKASGPFGLESVLITGAAQLLFLGVPGHAAVDLSVRLVQGDRSNARFAGVVNAVLRRIARDGADRLAQLEPLCLDTPAWLLSRWINAYGEDTARAIAHVNGREPPLDLTVKSEPDRWAERLHGRVLPTGSVRLAAHGAISALPGYAEGSWWVQDAAAALPVRLFGDVRGRSIADLCAAPGGKTSQLALAGARVTAVDRSEPRVARLRENLARTGLSAATVVASAEQWTPESPNDSFDAVLVDAPCTATGTIRRHPDIPWRKVPSDIPALAAVQERLLGRAIDLTKPGGTIVFCTCSLEPEEGELVAAAMIARDARIRRRAIAKTEFAGIEAFVTPQGDLRTLPCQWPDPDHRMAGLDGFFAARFERL